MSRGLKHLWRLPSGVGDRALVSWVNLLVGNSVNLPGCGNRARVTALPM